MPSISEVLRQVESQSKAPIHWEHGGISTEEQVLENARLKNYLTLCDVMVHNKHVVAPLVIPGDRYFLNYFEAYPVLQINGENWEQLSEYLPFRINIMIALVTLHQLWEIYKVTHHILIDRHLKNVVLQKNELAPIGWDIFQCDLEALIDVKNSRLIQPDDLDVERARVFADQFEFLRMYGPAFFVEDDIRGLLTNVCSRFFQSVYISEENSEEAAYSQLLTKLLDWQDSTELTPPEVEAVLRTFLSAEDNLLIPEYIY